MNSAREEILGRIRASLNRSPDTPVPLVPPSARVRPRTTGPTDAEIDLLFAEIGKLTGVTRRIGNRDGLQAALADLVQTEQVKKATLWATRDLQAWEVASRLKALGVELVSPQADIRAVAECDLGVTGVDAALPETGTLLLRSSPEKPRVVSLLPRVHLAIFQRSALRADLHQAFAEVKEDRYVVLITGPSRTADIELTLTLGVHGPKSLYAWLLNEP
ncbi:MAG: LutC/YkgG family protein [Candidatus Methylomirabilota bacterium]